VRPFPGGTAVPAYSPIQRDFLNTAPEAGLLYRLNDTWQFRGRAATSYGTPQISQLTVTSQGVSGNNSQLATQTNVGLDIGADWTPDRTVKLSVTGFYEFFRNEPVTQSPGAGLQNFTFNVPRSVHRGVEVAADWRPVPGWRLIAAYTYLSDKDRVDADLEAVAPATAQKNINLDTLSNIRLPVPGLDEQRVIVRRVELHSLGSTVLPLRPPAPAS
jgi:outer membrane receptor protein involved in Fe transport